MNKNRKQEVSKLTGHFLWYQINYHGRRHFKLFTNCHVSWDTLYLETGLIQKQDVSRKLDIFKNRILELTKPYEIKISGTKPCKIKDKD